MPLYSLASFDYPMYVMGFSSITTILSVGIILDIVAIVCYGLSNFYLRKWHSAQNISYDFGYRNNNAFAELSIKF